MISRVCDRSFQNLRESESSHIVISHSDTEENSVPPINSVVVLVGKGSVDGYWIVKLQGDRETDWTNLGWREKIV